MDSYTPLQGVTVEDLEASKSVDSESTSLRSGGGASLQERLSVAFGHRGPVERPSGTVHSKATTTIE